jgi:NTP pyrophosphatase (non-canonical NTP hydrolase)
MKGLSFARLREVNVARCNEAFHPNGGMEEWSPLEWAGAVAGEAGEAANMAKKLRRLDTGDQPLDSPEYRDVLADQIVEELADTVIYADLLAARVGKDLEEAIRQKFNKVSIERGVKHRL